MGGKLDQARTYIKHNSRVLLGVIGGIALASVAVGLWAIFSYIEPISAGERKDTLTLLAQIVAGLVLLLGVYLTYRRVTSAENAVEVAQEGQITERFTRAIAQLGDEKLAVRLGGIYALERIARDSERDHWPIMEVLTAFIRENARWKVPREGFDLTTSPVNFTQDIDQHQRPPADIQAILTVISRRERWYGNGEDQRLDLRETDLRGASLNEARLERAFLIGAHLEGTSPIGAHFEGANLDGAHLTQEQIESASGNDETRLPSDLKDAG